MPGNRRMTHLFSRQQWRWPKSCIPPPRIMSHFYLKSGSVMFSDTAKHGDAGSAGMAHAGVLIPPTELSITAGVLRGQ